MAAPREVVNRSEAIGVAQLRAAGNVRWETLVYT